MNTMHKNVLLFILTAFLTSFTGDPVDAVAGTFKSGDAHLLDAYFGSSIDLTLLDHEDVYGKDQAEIMLHDFFVKNPPKTFQVLHKGKSQEGTTFGIAKMSTSNGKNYRISFYVKTADNRLMLQELRIESE